MEFPRLLLAALTAMALCSAPTVNAQQPVKIRVSWVAPVSNWASIWLEKKDLAKHLGKSYTLEAVRYAGTPPMVTALASGELEVANLAYSTLAIAIKNAGMDDLRVIADEFRDGVPGHYTHEYLVLADGPIKKRRRTSRARWSPPMPPAAPSTSQCGRCCARTGWRTSATTPCWRRRSRPCGRCWPRRRST